MWSCLNRPPKAMGEASTGSRPFNRPRRPEISSWSATPYTKLKSSHSPTAVDWRFLYSNRSCALLVLVCIAEIGSLEPPRAFRVLRARRSAPTVLRRQPNSIGTMTGPRIAPLRLIEPGRFQVRSCSIVAGSIPFSGFFWATPYSSAEAKTVFDPLGIRKRRASEETRVCHFT